MNTKTHEKPSAPAGQQQPEAQLPAERKTGTDLAEYDFGDDAGKGLQDIDRSETRIPFIFILASNSPQVKPPAQGGIQGAQQGMIMNGGTGELFDVSKAPNGLKFLPCYRDHNFVEFVPKNLGGGFVAVHKPDDVMILQLQAKQGNFGRLSRNCTKRDPQGLPLDGTEISETFYLYGLLVDDFGSTSQVIVPFKSTQIKKYQNFIQRTKTWKYKDPRSTDEAPRPPIVPPIWAHFLRLGTTPEKNKKGEFWGWTLGLWERNDDGTEKPYRESINKKGSPLYEEAAEFNRMLESGEAKANYESDKGGDGEADETPM